jgi:DnaJ-class molecular chaperone
VRCYSMQSAADDPQDLLKEEHQWCAPWGGSENGERCDKCRGNGRGGHECWSCLLTGTNPSCPACRGRVRWEAACPVCRGSGKVEGEPRRGVSVFPTAEALYHHLLTREVDPVGLLVEIEADPTDDPDFYADQGALLAIPTEIVRVRPIEPEAVQTIRSLTEQ